MNRHQHDDYMIRIEEIIARVGWMVQGVFPTADSDPDQHSFCYTVGVEDKGGPEFLVIGVPGDLGQVILNRVVKRCLDTGRWPEHGERLSHVLDSFDLLAVRIPDEEALLGEWFNVALNRRGDPEGFVGYQLVVPDPANAFVASEAQPILGPA